MDIKSKILDPETVILARSSILKEKAGFLSSIKNFFYGKDLVDWLMTSHNPKNLSRSEMTELISTELMNPASHNPFIYSVDQKLFIDSPNEKFRFVEDHYQELKKDIKVINMNGLDISHHLFFYEKQNKRISEYDFDSFYPKLIQFLSEIYSILIGEDEISINYEVLIDSMLFEDKFIPFITYLPFIDLSPIIGNDDMIKAFFINIYNLMLIHIFCLRYFQKKNFEFGFKLRQEFSKTFKYNIAGNTYTLFDIESGILKVKIFEEIKFKQSDPRNKFCLNIIDPRIAFAFHIGTFDSPTLRIYDYQCIYGLLDIAEIEYLNNEYNLRFCVTKTETFLEISSYLSYIKPHVSKSDQEFIKYVIERIRDDKLKAKIENYNLKVAELKTKSRKTDWRVNFKGNEREISNFELLEEKEQNDDKAEEDSFVMRKVL